MGPSRAFGTINRTLLWETQYRKGLPGEKISQIRRGHQGTRLAPKYKGRYGEPKGNNIGVPQWSEIGAFLVIIYMDAMMGDIAAINRRSQLRIRILQDRPQDQNKQRMRGVIKTEE